MADTVFCLDVHKDAVTAVVDGIPTQNLPPIAQAQPRDLISDGKYKAKNVPNLL